MYSLHIKTFPARLLYAESYQWLQLVSTWSRMIYREKWEIKYLYIFFFYLLLKTDFFLIPYNFSQTVDDNIWLWFIYNSWYQYSIIILCLSFHLSLQWIWKVQYFLLCPAMISERLTSNHGYKMPRYVVLYVLHVLFMISFVFLFVDKQ